MKNGVDWESRYHSQQRRRHNLNPVEPFSHYGSSCPIIFLFFFFFFLSIYLLCFATYCRAHALNNKRAKCFKYSFPSQEVGEKRFILCVCVLCSSVCYLRKKKRGSFVVSQRCTEYLRHCVHLFFLPSDRRKSRNKRKG